MSVLLHRIGLAAGLIALSTGVSWSQELPDGSGVEKEDGGPAIHLVDVAFEVSGSLTPDSPITISARARSLEETLPVTLTIDLPEYSLVKAGYVNGQRELVEGTRIEPVFVDEAVVAAGSDMIRNQTITFDDPGLYTLEVTAIADVGDDPRWLSDNVIRASVKTAWILIAADGTGRVLDEPDVSVLPDGHIKTGS